MKRVLALLLVVLFAILASCQTYEPPPTVSIDFLVSGVLTDARAPLDLELGQPVDLSTLHMKVAFYDVDIEGNLPDEDDDPTNDDQLRVIVSHDPGSDFGGHAVITPDQAAMQFFPDSAFPVGPKLVLLVEGGLTGTGGRVRNNRTRIPFSFAVTCTAGKRADKLQSGIYFVLLDVDQPLGSQIQLYGAIDVDPATGAFTSQFTNADRNPDNSRCGNACASTEACRTLPAQDCVIPSQRAGTVDEYPDFVPNQAPPTGYSFTVEGCAIDEGNGAGIITAPATMVVQQPAVTVEGLTMTAFFAPDASGVPRATGSLVADGVLLDNTNIGAGKGNMTARLIPLNQIPPGVPPAPSIAQNDGGVDASP